MGFNLGFKGLSRVCSRRTYSEVTFPILISTIGEDMLVFQRYCEDLLRADGVEFLL